MAVLLTNSVATNGINKTVQMLNQNVSSLDAIESGIRLVESDPEAGWWIWRPSQSAWDSRIGCRYHGRFNS